MLKALVELRRSLWRHTTARFLVVGVWNSVFSFLCYAGLFYFSSGRYRYLWVLVPATILGVTNAFVCHRWITFRSKGSIVREYLRFYVVYGIQIGLNFALLPMAVELGHIPPMLAQITIVVLTTLLTYWGHARFSFAKVQNQPGRENE